MKNEPTTAEIGTPQRPELGTLNLKREPMNAKRGPKSGTPRKKFLRHDPKLVHRMHRDHLKGMNLYQLSKQYGYGDGNIKAVFEHYKLEVRIQKGAGWFPRTLRRRTEAELLSLARATKRIMVPHALRTEWREWSLEKRWWFIQEMVKIHGWKYELPSGPYSANVVPFNYGTPLAHEVAAKVNEGLNSQQWLCHLKISSRGVIYDGHLWSYVPENGYVRGVFVKHEGRKTLHRELYKAHHGPIPDDCVVRFIDGNENNLDPANLTLATRNDVARENQSAHLTAISRRKLQAILKHGTAGLPQAA